MTKTTRTLKELAELVDGELIGDPDTVVADLKPIETAMEGDITFFVKTRKPEDLKETQATAAIVPQSLETAPIPIIRVKEPYLATAKIQNLLLKKPFIATGIHKKTVIGQGCEIPEQVSIGPMTVVGDRVTIGNRVTIGPGVVVGDNVTIGDDTVIKANTTIGERCKVGERGLIHPGVVIGSDGYGFAMDQNGCHVKRPQLGIVVVGDDVEIGANCCIDRGTFGETRIRSGVKMDNLVHVAHNVDVGVNSLLIAQAGIAGSTTLGRNVVVGGAVGIKDHVHIGDGAMIAPKSGVHNNLEKGAIVCGIPAIPLRRFRRAAAAFGKLPDMHRTLQRLKRQVAELNKGEE